MIYHTVRCLCKIIISISGLLYNITETYDCAFYLAASLFLIAGAVMSLPVLKFHKPNKNGSNYVTNSGNSEVYSRSTSSIETQTFVEDLVEEAYVEEQYSEDLASCQFLPRRIKAIT